VPIQSRRLHAQPLRDQPQTQTIQPGAVEHFERRGHDFSHVSYVHIKSFGADEQWASQRPNITPLTNGVRVERWFMGSPGTRVSFTKPAERYSRSISCYPAYC
jgi:hypothetical protein